MLESLKTWWHRRYREPFTVACDRAMFWSPINQREELFHVLGLAKARKIMRAWVREHDAGQARIIPGHHFWKNDKGEEIKACSDGECCDPLFHIKYDVVT